ncbi:MAG: NADP-dependent phosphogluconate dehydrogenase [Deltaproteobacteria bacterium]|nr:NADP-dependent phosphogluconate dehydrogenase [Deltaproteobacteria bacterium]
MKKASVGLIGLGVMGANLIRNIAGKGYSSAVFNRTVSQVDRFMAEHGSENFIPTKSLNEFVDALEKPRTAFVMVTAGAAVDAVIDSLIPLLDKGDTIADLGNSYFKDTVRREKHCKERGINFLGIGVSGGEEGALHGPSIMPGGDYEAWQRIATILDEASAKAPDPCHVYIGPDGAGHFVKMVHNGIEYGDMQLIAEAYDLLKNAAGCDSNELAEIFTNWNQGELSSYLIEITSHIFTHKDNENGSALVEKIMDKASQKGTGKWTAQIALDLGVPIPTLAAAVSARSVSMLKNERLVAAKILPIGKLAQQRTPKKQFVEAVRDALYCSKIVSYAQGIALIQAASEEYNWNLDIGNIASIWRGGCIIRAQFLNEITRAYKENSGLGNLLLAPYMVEQIKSRIDNWRQVVAQSSLLGIPALAFTSALSYYDSYRREYLPQNLTQAQRDYFGAHTFERTDKEGTFHHQW